MTRTNFNEGLALIAEIPGTRNFGLLGVPFRRARCRIGHAQTCAHQKVDRASELESPVCKNSVDTLSRSFTESRPFARLALNNGLVYTHKNT
jgi:hypothetical protein